MEVRQIAEHYFVAPQIDVDDIYMISQAGFKSIISNRPDAEEGAVSHHLIEEAVRAAGLEFRYIPVVSGALTQDNIDDQAKALQELPKPVLAYCRSGARCTNLYMLVQEKYG